MLPPIIALLVTALSGLFQAHGPSEVFCFNVHPSAILQSRLLKGHLCMRLSRACIWVKGKKFDVLGPALV